LHLHCALSAVVEHAVASVCAEVQAVQVMHGAGLPVVMDPVYRKASVVWTPETMFEYVPAAHEPPQSLVG
jgi:hypothetical protein